MGGSIVCGVDGSADSQAALGVAASLAERLEARQVIAHVANAFGVDLSLRSLFSSPTIRQLSAEIERLIVARVEAMSDEEARWLLEQERNA